MRLRNALTGKKMIAHIQTFNLKDSLIGSIMVLKVLEDKGFPWMLMVRNSQVLLSKPLRRNGQS